MLGTLQQLREAAHLHAGLRWGTWICRLSLPAVTAIGEQTSKTRPSLRRASQETGDFAGAFWLCAQCARALAPLHALRVAPELGATVSALYEETVARLEGALAAACADFQPGPYAKARAAPNP